MEIIKKYIPLSLFIIYTTKLLISNDFSFEKVIALGILASLTALFEYHSNNKKLNELTKKLQEYQEVISKRIEKQESELEPLKTRMSSLQVAHNFKVTTKS